MSEAFPLNRKEKEAISWWRQQSSQPDAPAFPGENGEELSPSQIIDAIEQGTDNARWYLEMILSTYELESKDGDESAGEKPLKRRRKK